MAKRIRTRLSALIAACAIGSWTPYAASAFEAETAPELATASGDWTSNGSYAPPSALLGAGAPRDPGRYALADVESAVRKVCRASEPFLVLDTFSRVTPVNLDDGAPEDDRGDLQVTHGDIVAAIARMSHPAVAYQIDPVFNAFTLADDFRRVAEGLRSGAVALPAAIISAIVLPVDLRDVDARRPGERPIEGSDLTAMKGEILRVITDGHDDRNPYASISRSIAAIRAEGVPIFVAAGNTAPDRLVNALALNEGVYAVGALGRDGDRASYTSAPELVSLWSPGHFVVTERPGGLSLDGGRNVHLAGAALPQQRRVITQYAGHSPDGLVRRVPPDLAMLPSRVTGRQRARILQRYLAAGLYRTEELMSAYGLPPTSGAFARAAADGPYTHYPTDTIFRLTADGVLAFDPLGDGSPGQLLVQDATSFATPNICADSPGARMARRGP